MSNKKYLKLIEIPYSPVSLLIFTGQKGRGIFNTKVEFQHPEWVDDPDADGMHFQNNIYILDFDDKDILFHEITHFFQWLFEYMEIEAEMEFQANLSSHVICEILKY